MRKKIIILGLVFTLVLTLQACSLESQNVLGTQVDFETLSCTGVIQLSYAKQYSVEQYGVYDVITFTDSGCYLLVPEDEPVPYNLPEDITVLQQPLDKVYLVSTSAMDLVAAIDSISNIRLSGTKESDWHVEETVDAMKNGNMLYAGKYSMPDYELILNEGCDLAIENTMIYHNPEVKEKIEELGIPVLVERSSYESHPLGRLEWIRLYGILFGKEEEANNFYKEQLGNIETYTKKPEKEMSVAFFYVTSNGAVNVRKPGDYISQMISLAGGNYILNDMTNINDNALSTLNMQMEDFYIEAKDADVLIYNSTIEGELQSIDDLTVINSIFLDFKAVKCGNVYCTNSIFFQKTTGTCEFIKDLNKVFINPETEDYTFLKKLR